jgi:uncharacterized glyoxalase superfamily protein PhnB
MEMSFPAPVERLVRRLFPGQVATRLVSPETPDRPTVALSVLADPDKVSSFMNLRVADIKSCYETWKSRGAEFITEPKDKYGETRCYIRDPDGYIIEVGQSKPEFTYG